MFIDFGGSNKTHTRTNNSVWRTECNGTMALTVMPKLTHQQHECNVTMDISVCDGVESGDDVSVGTVSGCGFYPYVSAELFQLLGVREQCAHAQRKQTQAQGATPGGKPWYRTRGTPEAVSLWQRAMTSSRCLLLHSAPLIVCLH